MTDTRCTLPGLLLYISYITSYGLSQCASSCYIKTPNNFDVKDALYPPGSMATVDPWYQEFATDPNKLYTARGPITGQITPYAAPCFTPQERAMSQETRVALKKSPGNYMYPDIPTPCRAPIHACLAGYDGEIFNIIRDIKATTGTEIEVHFYLFHRCKFNLLESHMTSIEALQNVLASYHHYICLNKKYVEKYNEKEQCWYIEKLIMIPSFTRDLPSNMQIQDFNNICNPANKKAGFEPLCFEIDEKVNAKDINDVEKIKENESKYEMSLADINGLVKNTVCVQEGRLNSEGNVIGDFSMNSEYAQSQNNLQDNKLCICQSNPYVCQNNPCTCQNKQCVCQNNPCTCQNMPYICQNTPLVCQNNPCVCQKLPCICQNKPSFCQNVPCTCQNKPCIICQNMPCTCQNNPYIYQNKPCICQNMPFIFQNAAQKGSYWSKNIASLKNILPCPFNIVKAAGSSIVGNTINDITSKTEQTANVAATNLFNANSIPPCGVNLYKAASKGKQNKLYSNLLNLPLQVIQSIPKAIAASLPATRQMQLEASNNVNIEQPTIETNTAPFCEVTNLANKRGLDKITSFVQPPCLPSVCYTKPCNIPSLSAESGLRTGSFAISQDAATPSCFQTGSYTVCQGSAANQGFEKATVRISPPYVPSVYYTRPCYVKPSSARAASEFQAGSYEICPCNIHQEGDMSPQKNLEQEFSQGSISTGYPSTSSIVSPISEQENNVVVSYSQIQNKFNPGAVLSQTSSQNYNQFEPYTTGDSKVYTWPQNKYFTSNINDKGGFNTVSDYLSQQQVLKPGYNAIRTDQTEAPFSSIPISDINVYYTPLTNANLDAKDVVCTYNTTSTKPEYTKSSGSTQSSSSPLSYATSKNIFRPKPQNINTFATYAGTPKIMTSVPSDRQLIGQIPQLIPYDPYQKISTPHFDILYSNTPHEEKYVPEFHISSYVPVTPDRETLEFQTSASSSTQQITNTIPGQLSVLPSQRIATPNPIVISSYTPIQEIVTTQPSQGKIMSKNKLLESILTPQFATLGSNQPLDVTASYQPTQITQRDKTTINYRPPSNVKQPDYSIVSSNTREPIVKPEYQIIIADPAKPQALDTIVSYTPQSEEARYRQVPFTGKADLTHVSYTDLLSRKESIPRRMTMEVSPSEAPEFKSILYTSPSNDLTPESLKYASPDNLFAQNIAQIRPEYPKTGIMEEPYSNIPAHTVYSTTAQLPTCVRPGLESISPYLGQPVKMRDFVSIPSFSQRPQSTSDQFVPSSLYPYLYTQPEIYSTTSNTQQSKTTCSKLASVPLETKWPSNVAPTKISAFDSIPQYTQGPTSVTSELRTKATLPQGLSYVSISSNTQQSPTTTELKSVPLYYQPSKLNLKPSSNPWLNSITSEYNTIPSYTEQTTPVTSEIGLISPETKMAPLIRINGIPSTSQPNVVLVSPKTRPSSLIPDFAQPTSPSQKFSSIPSYCQMHTGPASPGIQSPTQQPFDRRDYNKISSYTQSPPIVGPETMSVPIPSPLSIRPETISDVPGYQIPLSTGKGWFSVPSYRPTNAGLWPISGPDTILRSPCTQLPLSGEGISIPSYNQLPTTASPCYKSIPNILGPSSIEPDIYSDIPLSHRPENARIGIVSNPSYTQRPMPGSKMISIPLTSQEPLGFRPGAIPKLPCTQQLTSGGQDMMSIPSYSQGPTSAGSTSTSSADPNFISIAPCIQLPMSSGPDRVSVPSYKKLYSSAPDNESISSYYCTGAPTEKPSEQPSEVDSGTVSISNSQSPSSAGLWPVSGPETILRPPCTQLPFSGEGTVSIPSYSQLPTTASPCYESIPNTLGPSSIGPKSVSASIFEPGSYSDLPFTHRPQSTKLGIFSNPSYTQRPLPGSKMISVSLTSQEPLGFRPGAIPKLPCTQLPFSAGQETISIPSYRKQPTIGRSETGPILSYRQKPSGTGLCFTSIPSYTQSISAPCFTSDPSGPCSSPVPSDPGASFSSVPSDTAPCYSSVPSYYIQKPSDTGPCFTSDMSYAQRPSSAEPKPLLISSYTRPIGEELGLTSKPCSQLPLGLKTWFDSIPPYTRQPSTVSIPSQQPPRFSPGISSYTKPSVVRPDKISSITQRPSSFGLGPISQQPSNEPCMVLHPSLTRMPLSVTPNAERGRIKPFPLSSPKQLYSVEPGMISVPSNTQRRYSFTPGSARGGLGSTFVPYPQQPSSKRLRPILKPSHTQRLSSVESGIYSELPLKAESRVDSIPSYTQSPLSCASGKISIPSITQGPLSGAPGTVAIPSYTQNPISGVPRTNASPFYTQGPGPCAPGKVVIPSYPEGSLPCDPEVAAIPFYTQSPISCAPGNVADPSYTQGSLPCANFPSSTEPGVLSVPSFSQQSSAGYSYDSIPLYMQKPSRFGPHSEKPLLGTLSMTSPTQQTPVVSEFESIPSYTQRPRAGLWRPQTSRTGPRFDSIPSSTTHPLSYIPGLEYTQGSISTESGIKSIPPYAERPSSVQPCIPSRPRLSVQSEQAGMPRIPSLQICVPCDNSAQLFISSKRPVIPRLFSAQPCTPSWILSEQASIPGIPSLQPCVPSVHSGQPCIPFVPTVQSYIPYPRSRQPGIPCVPSVQTGVPSATPGTVIPSYCQRLSTVMPDMVSNPSFIQQPSYSYTRPSIPGLRPVADSCNTRQPSIAIPDPKAIPLSTSGFEAILPYTQPPTCAETISNIRYTQKPSRETGIPRVASVQPNILSVPSIQPCISCKYGTVGSSSYTQITSNIKSGIEVPSYSQPLLKTTANEPGLLGFKEIPLQTKQPCAGSPVVTAPSYSQKPTSSLPCLEVKPLYKQHPSSVRSWTLPMPSYKQRLTESGLAGPAMVSVHSYTQRSLNSAPEKVSVTPCTIASSNTGLSLGVGSQIASLPSYTQRSSSVGSEISPRTEQPSGTDIGYESIPSYKLGPSSIGPKPQQTSSFVPCMVSIPSYNQGPSSVRPEIAPTPCFTQPPLTTIPELEFSSYNQVPLSASSRPVWTSSYSYPKQPLNARPRIDLILSNIRRPSSTGPNFTSIPCSQRPFATGIGSDPILSYNQRPDTFSFRTPPMPELESMLSYTELPSKALPEIPFNVQRASSTGPGYGLVPSLQPSVPCISFVQPKVSYVPAVQSRVPHVTSVQPTIPCVPSVQSCTPFTSSRQADILVAPRTGPGIGSIPSYAETQQPLSSTAAFSSIPSYSQILSTALPKITSIPLRQRPLSATSDPEAISPCTLRASQSKPIVSIPPYNVDSSKLKPDYVSPSKPPTDMTQAFASIPSYSQIKTRLTPGSGSRPLYTQQPLSIQQSYSESSTTSTKAFVPTKHTPSSQPSYKKQSYRQEQANTSKTNYGYVTYQQPNLAPCQNIGECLKTSGLTSYPKFFKETYNVISPYDPSKDNKNIQSYVQPSETKSEYYTMPSYAYQRSPPCTPPSRQTNIPCMSSVKSRIPNLPSVQPFIPSRPCSSSGIVGIPCRPLSQPCVPCLPSQQPCIPYKPSRPFVPLEQANIPYTPGSQPCIPCTPSIQPCVPSAPSHLSYIPSKRPVKPCIPTMQPCIPSRPCAPSVPPGISCVLSKQPCITLRPCMASEKAPIPHVPCDPCVPSMPPCVSHVPKWQQVEPCIPSVPPAMPCVSSAQPCILRVLSTQPCTPCEPSARPCIPCVPSARPCTPCVPSVQPCIPWTKPTRTCIPSVPLAQPCVPCVPSVQACIPCVPSAQPCIPCVPSARPCIPCVRSARPCTPCVPSARPCIPCVPSARPCIPCVPSAQPLIPYVPSARPCVPCVPSVQPCIPWASSARPCTPCIPSARPCIPFLPSARPCVPSVPSARLCVPCVPSARPCVPFVPSVQPCIPWASSARPCIPFVLSTQSCTPCVPSARPFVPCVPSVQPYIPCVPSTRPCVPCIQSVQRCIPWAPSARLYIPCVPSTQPCTPCVPSARPFKPCVPSLQPCLPWAPSAQPRISCVPSARPFVLCAPSARPCVPCVPSARTCIPCVPSTQPYTPCVPSARPCVPCLLSTQPCTPCMPSTQPCTPCVPSVQPCIPCVPSLQTCIPCVPSTRPCTPCVPSARPPCVRSAQPCLPCLPSGQPCTPCVSSAQPCIPCIASAQTIVPGVPSNIPSVPSSVPYSTTLSYPIPLYTPIAKSTGPGYNQMSPHIYETMKPYSSTDFVIPEVSQTYETIESYSTPNYRPMTKHYANAIGSYKPPTSYKQQEESCLRPDYDICNALLENDVAHISNIELASLVERLKYCIESTLKSNNTIAKDKCVPLGNVVVAQTNFNNQRPFFTKFIDNNLQIKGFMNKVKVLKAKLIFEEDEIEVPNFIPVVKCSEMRDPEEIQKIAANAIKQAYDGIVVMKTPCTKDLSYVVLKNLPISDGQALLWPPMCENNSLYTQSGSCSNCCRHRQ